MGDRGGGAQPATDYGKLAAHLAARAESCLTLTFDEVEAIVGGLLPLAARLGPYWWGNHRQGRRQHGRAWQEAGWRVAGVDAHAGRVTFVREPAG